MFAGAPAALTVRICDGHANGAQAWGRVECDIVDIVPALGGSGLDHAEADMLGDLSDAFGFGMREGGLGRLNTPVEPVGKVVPCHEGLGVIGERHLSMGLVCGACLFALGFVPKVGGALR